MNKTKAASGGGKAGTSTGDGNNPKKPTDMGMNRTGIGMSPMEAQKTIDGAREGVPVAEPDGAAIAAVRTELSRAVEPLGTVPPPASLKGMAKAAVQMLKGNKPTVLLDLVAERLAFERTGTRLYEALLSKLDAADEHPGGPTRQELVAIRDDELAHFLLLKDAMERLGGDPTAVTPSADVAAVASLGLLQVVSDPRVTLTEALKAVQIAELTDNDAWLGLADLADRLGQDELAQEFRRALAEEEDHLALVRGWVTAAVEGQAGLDTETDESAPSPTP